jgi:hypothetical protein
MPRYNVTVPFAGYLVMEIEADDAAMAEEIAFDANVHIDCATDQREEIEFVDVGEWDLHKQIVRGNVLYASQNAIEIEEIVE